MNIEVCYANPERQERIAIDLPATARVMDAIQASHILTLFPEIDLTTAKLGIFSIATTLESELHDGDRVEIYRPLLCDPKQKRRERAKTNKNPSKS